MAEVNEGTRVAEGELGVVPGDEHLDEASMGGFAQVRRHLLGSLRGVSTQGLIDELDDYVVRTAMDVDVPKLAEHVVNASDVEFEAKVAAFRRWGTEGTALVQRCAAVLGHRFDNDQYVRMRREGVDTAGWVSNHILVGLRLATDCSVRPFGMGSLSWDALRALVQYRPKATKKRLDSCSSAIQIAPSLEHIPVKRRDIAQYDISPLRTAARHGRRREKE